ncbi:MAG: FkbM family methyltransferase [Rhodospirillales bacterium]|nr:FkbM family methyltransferase [Rhodospirillales bacterium]
MPLAAKIKKNLAVYLPSVQRRLLSGMSQGEIETVARHVAERCERNPSEKLVAFARALAEKATAVPNMFHANGEEALLDRLASDTVRVVFDVGANVGTWSRHALKVFPRAQLHAFEIVPQTCDILQGTIGGDERVHINPFGLSDAHDSVDVHLYSSNLISSMFTLQNEQDSRATIRCEVRRGADYAAAQGLDRIDMLKVDVEGAEGKVFSGFEPMFSKRQIGIVQFEYNRGAILGNFLLKHAYEFFRPRGYRLGKLGPEGVAFHEYELAHEDFLGPNYVACREEDAETIARISTFH